MKSVLAGLGLAAMCLLKNNKKLSKWVEKASPDNVREGLTQLFLKGNGEWNFGPALTTKELAAFDGRFKSISLASTGLEECLSFYAGYPFQPLSLPLSKEGLLRAVIEITGRDSRALDEKSTIRREGKERVIMQGRNSEDKLILLFTALAGGTPTQENILDVLSLVQPRPNECHTPLGHEELRPMAMRLAPTPISSTATGLTIPKEKLLVFIEAINLEPPVLKADNIDFNTFRDIANKSGFVSAVSQRVEAIFLNT